MKRSRTLVVEKPKGQPRKHRGNKSNSEGKCRGKKGVYFNASQKNSMRPNA